MRAETDQDWQNRREVLRQNDFVEATRRRQKENYCGFAPLRVSPVKVRPHITEFAPQLTKFSSKVDRVRLTIKQAFSFVVNPIELSCS